MPENGKESTTWMKRPALVERVKRVHIAKMEGKHPLTIAQEEGITPWTVWRDTQRAYQLMRLQAAAELFAARNEALLKREHIQSVAYEDREQASIDDASGRASLLRVVADSQTAIEELQGLREKGEAAAATAVTTVVVSLDGIEKTLEKLDDEELDQLLQRLGKNGEEGEYQGGSS